VTERDLLVFGPAGPENNTLRFHNECARHKALDLIGDLALTGLDVVGRIIARRSGHQLNGLMAERICQMATAHVVRGDQGEHRREAA
jgi:UDP-3-O-acyl-N-acetylglucosamine deacetylase